MRRPFCAFLWFVVCTAFAAHASDAASPQPPAAAATSIKPTAATGSVIKGSAVTSSSDPVADAAVRLRDARTGRVIDNVLADKRGVFEFKSVPPGTYVVEIVGADKAVIAASQAISVNAGEAISAIVRLPFKVSTFANIAGHTVSSAVAVTSAAAASQVMSAVITTPTSPPSGRQ